MRFSLIRMDVVRAVALRDFPSGAGCPLPVPRGNRRIGSARVPLSRMLARGKAPHRSVAYRQLKTASTCPVAYTVKGRFKDI